MDFHSPFQLLDNLTIVLYMFHTHIQTNGGTLAACMCHQCKVWLTHGMCKLSVCLLLCLALLFSLLFSLYIQSCLAFHSIHYFQQTTILYQSLWVALLCRMSWVHVLCYRMYGHFLRYSFNWKYMMQRSILSHHMGLFKIIRMFMLIRMSDVLKTKNTKLRF